MSQPASQSSRLPIDVVSDDPGPDSEARRKQEAELVTGALGRLDADQREAIVLREYQGLSYEEIAEVTGVAVGTVKSRIFRGKLELRKLLEPLLGAKSDQPTGGRVIPLRSPSQ